MIFNTFYMKFMGNFFCRAEKLTYNCYRFESYLAPWRVSNLVIDLNAFHYLYYPSRLRGQERRGGEGGSRKWMLLSLRVHKPP